jgi:hypothetical protein
MLVLVRMHALAPGSLSKSVVEIEQQRRKEAEMHLFEVALDIA